MIEPVIEALTTLVRPFDRANSAMINSAAFPKVAFKSPPIPWPRCSARCSVARPIHQASGMIAMHEQMNRAVGFSRPGTKRNRKAIGTNRRSQFKEGLSHDRGAILNGSASVWDSLTEG